MGSSKRMAWRLYGPFVSEEGKGSCPRQKHARQTRQYPMLPSAQYSFFPPVGIAVVRPGELCILEESGGIRVPCTCYGNEPRAL